MKFVVLLEDNPEADQDIRSKYMSAHLDFLESHASVIDAAGPLFETNGTGAGGVWIVNAETESMVHQLVEQDPFWATGLRKSVRVLSWTQVFADGVKLISP